MQIQSIKSDLDVYLDECIFICEKGSVANFNVLEWCTHPMGDRRDMAHQYMFQKQRPLDWNRTCQTIVGHGVWRVRLW